MQQGDRLSDFSDEELLRAIRKAGGEIPFAHKLGITDRWLRKLLVRRGIKLKKGRPKKPQSGELKRTYHSKFAKWWFQTGRYAKGFRNCRDFANASEIHIDAVRSFFYRRKCDFQRVVETRTDLIKCGRPLKSVCGKIFPAAALEKVTRIAVDPYSAFVTFNAILRPGIPVKIRLALREYLGWFGITQASLVDQVSPGNPRTSRKLAVDRPPRKTGLPGRNPS